MSPGKRAGSGTEARDVVKAGEGSGNGGARLVAAENGGVSGGVRAQTMRRYEVTFGPYSSVVIAKTAGKAKYEYAMSLADGGPVDSVADAFRRIRCRSLGPAGSEARYVTRGAALASEVDRKRDAQDAADAWNAARPIGTLVRYWTGCREGDGKTSRTRSRAQSIGSHASVWVEGEASCINLSHVEVCRGE